MKRVLLVVALALSLQGCWFVFIPGSLIQAIVNPNNTQEPVTEANNDQQRAY